MSASIIFYGHATLGLEIDAHKILVDPFFSGNPATSISASSVQAHFILITHGHDDHVGDAVSIAKRTGAIIISNFEIANWMESQGIKTSHAQHIGGGFFHPFGYLKLTQALHGSSMPDGVYGGNPVGFIITTKDKQKIYIAGDTGLFGDMRLIGEENIDLAIIPIGDNYTMGPDDALKAVKLLNPKHVIPVHYNTWPLIAQDASAWGKRVSAETTTQVHLLKPGDSFTL